MEGIDLSTILDSDALSGFFPEDNAEEQDTESSETQESKDNEDDAEEQEHSTPESVGDSPEDEDTGEPLLDEAPKASPANKVSYATIAKALSEDGVFPDLSDDDINNIKSAADFRALIDGQIKAGTDERTQRVWNVLQNGGDNKEIQIYENSLQFLNNITDELLTEESEQGEDLRKRLIYQDCLNRGYSKQRAERYVKQSVDTGNDIDDARDALEGNKEFFGNKYAEYRQKLQDDADSKEKARNHKVEEVKKDYLDTKEILGGLKVDRKTMEKAFAKAMSPTYRDPKSGEILTELGRYQREHPDEFTKNLAVIFTLTDGFKNMDKLVSGKVKQGVKKGLDALEDVLNGTSRGAGGKLDLMSGVSTDDPDSYDSIFSGNWKLAL